MAPFLFDGHVIKLGEHEIPTGTPYTSQSVLEGKL